MLKLVPALPIRKGMDPIRGTAESLAMTRIAIDATASTGKRETGAMKMSLDVMRDSGQQLVEMLDNLGQNIDTYA